MAIPEDDPPAKTGFWSTGDPCVAVQHFLEKECGGDITEAIRRLTLVPCSWKSARQMSEAFSHCLGITPAEFMKRWRAVRGGPWRP